MEKPIPEDIDDLVARVAQLSRNDESWLLRGSEAFRDAIASTTDPAEVLDEDGEPEMERRLAEVEAELALLDPEPGCESNVPGTWNSSGRYVSEAREIAERSFRRGWRAALDAAFPWRPGSATG